MAVPIRILVKFLFLELWNISSVHGHNAVLFIDDLVVHNLPFALGGLFAEVDESVVAVNVEFESVPVEPLCDGGFHLANGSPGLLVEIDQGSTLAMHDEVAIGAAFFGYFDKLIDCDAATPCYFVSWLATSQAWKD